MGINKYKKKERKTNNTLALRVGITFHTHHEPQRQAFSQPLSLPLFFNPGSCRA